MADIGTDEAVRDWSTAYTPTVIEREAVYEQLVLELRAERDYLREMLRLALASNTEREP